MNYTQNRPFCINFTPQVLQHIQNGNLLECPRYCPEEAYAIMLDCWKRQPQDRLTMKEIRLKLDKMCLSEPTYLDLIAWAYGWSSSRLLSESGTYLQFTPGLFTLTVGWHGFSSGLKSISVVLSPPPPLPHAHKDAALRRWPLYSLALRRPPHIAKFLNTNRSRWQFITSCHGDVFIFIYKYDVYRTAFVIFNSVDRWCTAQM